jgi:hypothetical protein
MSPSGGVADSLVLLWRHRGRMKSYLYRVWNNIRLWFDGLTTLSEVEGESTSPVIPRLACPGAT